MPADRQTAVRVEHPQHGACVVRYDNGPSTLTLPSGEVLPVASALLGWSRDEGSRLTVDGVRCRVLRHGDVHRRAWMEGVGEGWLVDLAGGLGERFEADDGEEVAFSWRRVAAFDCPDGGQWRRYTDRFGEAYVLRMGGAPDAVTPGNGPAQMALAGVK